MSENLVRASKNVRQIAGPIEYLFNISSIMTLYMKKNKLGSYTYLGNENNYLGICQKRDMKQ